MIHVCATKRIHVTARISKVLDVELTDYWKVFRAHWMVIIVITCGGAAAGFGWALMQPKVYEANASGIVSLGVSRDLGTAMAGESFAKSRVSSYLDLAKSRSVAEIAIEELGLDADPDALVSRITVSNPLETATLKVSARAGTPEEARNLAEAWVVAIGKQVSKIENVNAQGSEQSIVAFTSLDSAQLPRSPSSPNTRLGVMLGGLVGLALAIGYAMMRHVLDRRIRSVAMVESETGASVVGSIPRYAGFRDDNRLIPSLNEASTGGTDDDHQVAEALRELRTNLQFIDVDNPPRSIVITSAVPGEGKSTVAANLATAIAAAGQDVVVIDADLRRPVLARTLGLVPGVGLTDVLVGHALLADVLQPYGDVGGLSVLGAGKLPPNPSELLGSNAMRALIEEISERALVLIDTPPLLAVTDAALLAARTDGALLVSRAGRTTYEMLNEALHSLERVQGRALGVILTGVPNKGAGAEGYGQRYRSYYDRLPDHDAVAQPQDLGDVAGDLVEAATGVSRPGGRRDSDPGRWLRPGRE